MPSISDRSNIRKAKAYTMLAEKRKAMSFSSAFRRFVGVSPRLARGLNWRYVVHSSNVALLVL